MEFIQKDIITQQDINTNTVLFNNLKIAIKRMNDFTFLENELRIVRIGYNKYRSFYQKYGLSIISDYEIILNNRKNNLFQFEYTISNVVERTVVNHLIELVDNKILLTTKVKISTPVPFISSIIIGYIKETNINRIFNLVNIIKQFNTNRTPFPGLLEVNTINFIIVGFVSSLFYILRGNRIEYNPRPYITSFVKTFTPYKIVIPESIDDLRQIINNAKRNKLFVTMIGSKHSFNGGFTTNGYLINMEKFNNIETIVNNTVKVGAGLVINDLVKHLNSFGYSLPISGSIGLQTISGIISSGTHGSSSIVKTSLSEYVTEIEIMDGNGNIKVFNENDGDAFSANILAFGTLGIIINVTLKIVPAYTLKGSINWYDDQFYFNNYQEIIKDIYHGYHFWFPDINKVVIFNANKDNVSQFDIWLNEILKFVPNLIFFIIELIHRTISLIDLRILRIIYIYLFCLAYYIDYIGGNEGFIMQQSLNNNIISNDIVSRFKSIIYQEYCFDSKYLLAFYNETKLIIKNKINQPVIQLRFGSRDTHTLIGNAVDINPVWIGYKETKVTENSVFRQIEKIMLKYNARVHWAKEPVFPQNRRKCLIGLEDNYKRFLQIKKIQDPDTIFENNINYLLQSTNIN